MKVSNANWPGERLDLVDDGLIHLRRMAAGLEQGEDQRGELVAHRDAGEMDARALTRLGNTEGGTQRVLAVLAQGDLVGEFGDVDEQAAQLLGLGAVVQGGDQLDRALELLEVGLELGLDVGVQHGRVLFCTK